MQAVIQVPEEVVREEAAKQIEEKLKSFDSYFLIDVNKMAELTCMSASFLEENILSDVRMRQIERRINRKRWYDPEEAKAAIDLITSEW